MRHEHSTVRESNCSWEKRKDFIERQGSDWGFQVVMFHHRVMKLAKVLDWIWMKYGGKVNEVLAIVYHFTD